PHAAVGPDNPVNSPMRGDSRRDSGFTHATAKIARRTRMTVRRILLMISLAGLACRGEATAPPATVAKAGDPLLQHHEIRPDQLPAPFATPSAGNPPSVSSRPPGAALHLPPEFRATLWAAGLDDPRNMVYAPNGDLFIAESGAGRITVFRGGAPN